LIQIVALRLSRSPNAIG